MIISLKIEEGKDKTGKKKQVMWATLHTGIEGIGSFGTVAELPKRSVLGKEIEFLKKQMLETKKADIKLKNQAKIAKKKKELLKVKK